MNNKSSFTIAKRSARAQMSALQVVAVVIIFALIAALIIVTLSRSSTMARLRQSEESLVLSVYANVTALKQAYEDMSLPGADVGNVILPQMRIDLNAARTVNDILVRVYGDDRAVLSDDIFAQIDASIAYMEDVIEMGKSQTEAKQQMGACMEKVQIAMAKRFPQDTMMMPVTT